MEKRKNSKIADLTSDPFLPTHLPTSDIIRCSLTYLPTQKSDVICECSLVYFFQYWLGCPKGQFLVEIGIYQSQQVSSLHTPCHNAPLVSIHTLQYTARISNGLSLNYSILPSRPKTNQNIKFCLIKIAHCATYMK